MSKVAEIELLLAEAKAAEAAEKQKAADDAAKTTPAQAEYRDALAKAEVFCQQNPHNTLQRFIALCVVQGMDL